MRDAESNTQDIRRGLTAAGYVPTAKSKQQADNQPHEFLTLPNTFLDRPAVIVPDVSFYQDQNTTPRKVDFAAMKAAGARGVILRAGQGAWVDEDFGDYWRAAKDAGLPLGTYWYYDPRVDLKQQADLWGTLIGASKPELDNWSDFEYPASWGGAFAGWQNLYNFQERVRLLGVLQAIYTGYYWWYDNVWSKTTSAQLAYFSKYPLALAWYTSQVTQVKIPAPWANATWRWWQFTDKGAGATYGVESANIDLDYFNGEEAAYRSTFGLDTVTPPPPPGGDLVNTITLCKQNMNARRSPDGTQANIILDSTGATMFKTGDVLGVEAVVTGPDTAGVPSTWAAVSILYRAGVFHTRFSPPVYAYYPYQTDLAAILPAGALPPLPVSLVLGDDKTYAKQAVNVTLNPVK